MSAATSALTTAKQQALLDAQTIAGQQARIGEMEAQVAQAIKQAPDLAPTATAAPADTSTATPEEIAVAVAHLFGSALTLAITAATAQPVASAPANASTPAG